MIAMVVAISMLNIFIAFDVSLGFAILILVYFEMLTFLRQLVSLRTLFGLDRRSLKMMTTVCLQDVLCAM